VEKIRAAATMVGDGDGRWLLLQRICVYFFFYSGVPRGFCNRTVLIKFNPFLKKNPFKKIRKRSLFSQVTTQAKTQERDSPIRSLEILISIVFVSVAQKKLFLCL
jgi:hypothetical protein